MQAEADGEWNIEMQNHVNINIITLPTLLILISWE